MRKLAFLTALATLLALMACAPAEKPAEEPAAEPAADTEEAAPAPEQAMARAVLRNAEGAEIGTATFTQEGDLVKLVAEVHGVEGDGLHGFHVHELGECVPPDFKAAGGHFNPESTPHACPPDPVRHGGDFGNIETLGGNGLLEGESQLVTVVEGPRSVVGRAVILHAGEDDCVTQPTGDAGARFACGVVVSAGAAEEAGEDETEEAGGEDESE